MASVSVPAGISCPVVLVTVAFRWYPEVSVNTAVEELMDNIPSVDSADVVDSMALADGVGAYNNINAWSIPWRGWMITREGHAKRAVVRIDSLLRLSVEFPCVQPCYLPFVRIAQHIVQISKIHPNGVFGSWSGSPSTVSSPPICRNAKWCTSLCTRWLVPVNQ